MSVVIILILLAAIVAFFVLRSGESVRFETASEPQQVIMAAVGLIGSKRRWQTLSQESQSVTFRYHKGPNALVAVLLLLCFLIPGILYLVLAGKRESLVLNIRRDTNSRTTVQVTSNGFRGKAAGQALRRQLSVPAVPARPT